MTDPKPLNLTDNERQELSIFERWEIRDGPDRRKPSKPVSSFVLVTEHGAFEFLRRDGEILLVRYDKPIDPATEVHATHTGGGV